MKSGTEINLGGRKFTIPPLTLGMLRDPDLRNTIKAIDDAVATAETIAAADFYDLFDKRAKVILVALRKNYGEAELSETDFNDLLDLRNIRDIWPIVIGSSFEPPDPESPSGPARPEVPPIETAGT